MALWTAQMQQRELQSCHSVESFQQGLGSLNIYSPWNLYWSVLNSVHQRNYYYLKRTYFSGHAAWIFVLRSCLNELLNCQHMMHDVSVELVALGPLSDAVSLTQMIDTQLLSISCPLLCVKCWHCIKAESFPQQPYFSFPFPDNHHTLRWPLVVICVWTKNESWDPIFVL